MKRLLLFILVSGCVFLMVTLPGLHDTRRTALAWRHYHDAPGDATRGEIQEAKRLDRREILLWEVVPGTVLFWPVIALVRLTRRQP